MHPKKNSVRLSQQILDVMFAKRAFDSNPTTEKQLSAIFNTSRAPIRDALIELESDELVERRKKKGVYIRRPSTKKIAEVYDLRILLEGYAVRLSTQSATKEDLDYLHYIAKRHQESMKENDLDKCEAMNRAFHRRIVELSGNDTLIRLINSVDVIRKAFRIAFSIKPDIGDDQSPYPHETILARMIEKDADGAEELLKKHIQRGKQRTIEQYLGIKLDTVV